MPSGHPGAMTETTHPAVAARRRRIHQIRVRIAATAVGLFIAVFSVIYAQTPHTATGVATAQRSQSSDDDATASSSASSPTPMTTSQS